MSAPASEPVGISRPAVLLAAAVLAWSGVAAAQTPPASSKPAAPAAAMSSSPAADGRYAIQVNDETLDVHLEPSARSSVIAQLQKAARVEADARQGTWFRVTLSDGRHGWIGQVAGEFYPNFAVDAAPAVAATATATGTNPTNVASAAGGAPDDRIMQRRPMGKPLEAVMPVIDPSQVPPPAPFLPRETVPIPDRWRLVDQLKLVNQRWYDPYNPNELKGDRPIHGDDWFFNLSVISDTVFEARRLPTPIGLQSTQRPQSNDQFGHGKQSTFNENLIVSLSYLKGDTTFKPPEFEFRLVPVFNYNYTRVREVRALNIDPGRGTTRSDGFAAIQEAFVDYEYRIDSDRYDFDDVRVGIQPFISDFRGFLFQDVPLGIRFFGNRDNNQWQYNVGWFRRLEKNTNSGLNNITKKPRDDDVFFANLYRQDFMVPGFTLQGTAVYNVNRETATEFLDNNGFQVRPAVLGDLRPKSYNVLYLGASGDGHFGRWNTTGTLYWAIGHDDHNQLSQDSARINAFFAAAELSHDFDWVRVRGSALYASGDKDPYDGKENGFDAILENPQFAGADTSFWIRQAVPLIGGGGVALSGRNAVLPSLRSSKDQGQSNFTNPGLWLLGVGADVDITPRWRGIANVNQLWFDHTASLAVQRNQGAINRGLGTDVSVAVQYRPLFIQNIVLNVSAAVLIPGKGFKQLYETGGGSTPYSILANLTLAF
ncbi:MAG: SH3 domain-containing protein [Betaproteobacteria bacterium]|nr:SH3 domain-containing protein [Betaproteobacteria bacterium]